MEGEVQDTDSHEPALARHEPIQGKFDWTGDRDLGAFLQLAQKVGACMHASCPHPG